MGEGQILCLIFMFVIGLISSIPISALWDEYSNKLKVLSIGWLVFWLWPPLYFLWTKGVMG